MTAIKLAVLKALANKNCRSCGGSGVDGVDGGECACLPPRHQHADRCSHGVPYEHETLYCPTCLSDAMRGK